jgi:hypothetical protein
MRQAALLVLLAIGVLLAAFSFARRFEDERMVYTHPQLASNPNPSGVVEPIDWRAAAADAAVVSGGVLVGALFWRRFR